MGGYLEIAIDELDIYVFYFVSLLVGGEVYEGVEEGAERLAEGEGVVHGLDSGDMEVAVTEDLDYGLALGGVSYREDEAVVEVGAGRGLEAGLGEGGGAFVLEVGGVPQSLELGEVDFVI